MVDLFETLDEGVVLVDSAGGVVFVNRVALRWGALLDESGEPASGRAQAMVAWLSDGTLVDGAEMMLDDLCEPNGESVHAGGSLLRKEWPHRPGLSSCLVRCTGRWLRATLRRHAR